MVVSVGGGKITGYAYGDLYYPFKALNETVTTTPSVSGYCDGKVLRVSGENITVLKKCTLRIMATVYSGGSDTVVNSGSVFGCTVSNTYKQNSWASGQVTKSFNAGATINVGSCTFGGGGARNPDGSFNISVLSLD